jgi:predicted nucleic acid-binding protein
VIVADASFWVSAFFARDAHHDEASNLLRRIVGEEIPVTSPTLAVVEVAGALTRRTNDPQAVEAVLSFLYRLSQLSWAPLTLPFSEATAKVAISCSLRGADAIYVALAQQRGIPLITRDKEILSRGQSAAVILTPTDWLRQNPETER